MSSPHNLQLYFPPHLESITAVSPHLVSSPSPLPHAGVHEHVLHVVQVWGLHTIVGDNKTLELISISFDVGTF